MEIPKAKSRKKATKKSERESGPIRRTAYAISIIIILLMAVSVELYAKGFINEPILEAYTSILLSLFLTSIVFSYLLHKGKSLKTILKELGLTRDKLTLKNILIGVILFGAVIALGVILTIFSTITNIPLPTNVQVVLAGTPLYFLVFSFLIAPINEEIFFRGFLTPRVGIILSAVIFAILHLSYLSVSEFLAAFVFGLIAGYAFQKLKSLYPSITAHMLVNFVTVISLISFGMFIHF